MFYDNFCNTDNQKAIFNAITQLSKNNCYISIQELDYLNIPRYEIEEILSYFESNGLFREVQHLEESFPVIFRV